MECQLHHGRHEAISVQSSQPPLMVHFTQEGIEASPEEKCHMTSRSSCSGHPRFLPATPCAPHVTLRPVTLHHTFSQGGEPASLLAF